MEVQSPFLVSLEKVVKVRVDFSVEFFFLKIFDSILIKDDSLFVVSFLVSRIERETISIFGEDRLKVIAAADFFILVLTDFKRFVAEQTDL